MSNATAVMHIERDGLEVEVILDGTFSRYHPAQVWGPPELCSPAEGGELESFDATANGKPFELNASELDTAEELLWEALPEDDFPEPDYD